MRGVILLFIIIYQRILSPLFPRTCIYYPSCSTYMYQAVERFGIIKGMKYGLKRIVRCNPLSRGGYDPVPEE
ncbi:MAG TPA: membrane protein insertion efficiency factor YidD [Bacillota bacterium]|nr:membrane protein insertion efficiency factor YidD [Bacillota bacterium]HOL10266.1 membrane protein insertion efficiency factor YidD [Bacillota bacterium]